MRKLSKKAFVGIAHEIAQDLGDRVESNFETFLGFVYDFPIVANKKGGVRLAENSSEEEVVSFLSSYLPQNFAARKKKIVLNELGTVPDPAVDVVLEVFGKHHKDDLRAMQLHHRASMAAESKIGQLLEAYLATYLEPKGWFWCSCNVVKGVDFFEPAKPPRLLQVKNRSNSENSSSQAIRKTLQDAGCPVRIDKWYRIESTSTDTNWSQLDGNKRGDRMSEAGFHNFIRTYEID